MTGAATYKTVITAKAGDPVRCGFSALSLTSLSAGRPVKPGDDPVNPHSRRDAPEVCMSRPRREGAGKAGCTLHPRSRVQLAQKMRTRAYRSSGASRLSLRDGFTAYNELSPVNGLCCRRCGCSHQLDTSVAVPGYDCRRVSRASVAAGPPHPAFVTCATPLLSGETADSCR